MKTFSNKIILTYFTYLFFSCILFLTYHLNEFPNKYVFTDWLINYEGGFVRRGLLGQIIYKTAEITNLEIKYIILYFQIFSYLVYFYLFWLFFQKIKINYFWYLLVFSPVLFLYPLSELEALGRKEIIVITLFLLFAYIKYNNLNNLIYSFVGIFSLSTLIHEVTVFYFFHYIFVIYLKNKFQIKKKFSNTNYLLIFFSIIILLYLSLYLHNFVNLQQIVSSYSYGLSIESGSFSHIKPKVDEAFIKILNKVNFFSFLRIIFLILITLSPLFFFVRIEKKYMTKFLNLKILIFISLILSIPLYFLMFVLGRVIYINYNYLVVILILLFSFKVIDENYLDYKIKNLKKRLKIPLFIFICLLFSPKILATDDLASLPLYKSVIKIIKITFI